MNKTYDYIHAEGVIREKATMIDPGDNWPRGDDAVWEHDKVIDMKARKREYDQHIASLKTYPVYPSLRELWGADREVTIDVDFYLACVNDDCDCRFARHCKGPYTAYPEAPYNTDCPICKGTGQDTTITGFTSYCDCVVGPDADTPVEQYNAAEGLLDEQSVTVSEDELWDEVESWIVTFTGSTKMEAVRLCQKLKIRYTLLTKQHR